MPTGDQLVQEETVRFRDLRGKLRALFSVVTVAMAAFQLYTAADRPLETMQQRSLHLLFVLLVVFMVVPAWGRAGSRPSIPDILLALAGVAVNVYVFLLYSTEIVFRQGLVTTADLVLGAIALLVVLEATRRTIGLIMPTVAVIFLLYAAFGAHLPVLQHRGYDWERIISQQYTTLDGIYGTILSVSATVVYAFVFFGAALRISGGGQAFVDIAKSLLGGVRGGPAKVAVVGSALFGTVSGSAVANVVGTGSITIPMMKGIGYPPHFAGAVEAVASTGGQLMPPVMGAAAFIMAEVLAVSYWSIAKAAAIPAILYYLSLLVAVDCRAAKVGLRGLPRAQLEPIRSVLRRGWYFIIPVVLLFYWLGAMQWSAAKSAFWGTVAILVVGALRPQTRLTPDKFISACEDAARAVSEVAPATACAGIITGVMMLTGLGLKLSAFLVALAGGSLVVLLLLTTIVAIILGMGLPTTAVYILLAVLVAPALVSLGVAPIAAHLFVFYFGLLSAITPPVCLAAFAGASIAGSHPMQTGFTAWKLGLAVFIVPFAWIYSPALLMVGDPLEVGRAFVTSLIGVSAVAVSTEGFLMRPVPMLFRVLYMLGGIMLIVPEPITDGVGLLLVVLSVARQIIVARRGGVSPADATERGVI